MANTQLLLLIAIAISFLAMLSCAGAQSPASAPAPMQHKTQAPVQQPSPAPMTYSAPPAPMTPMGSPEMAPLPASNDCFTAVLNMSSCLSYVQAGSNLTSPETGCCPALAGLVESNPICLCQLFGSSKSYGIELNMNKALKLPSVCQINTPPLNTCALLGIPVGAPTDGGQTYSGMSPSEAPSSVIAAPPESNNGRSRFRIPAPVFLIGLSVAAATIF